MSRLVVALSGLVGIIVAAIILLALLLDNPEAYKQQLSQTFETQTGYGLEINGDLSWQYFPPIAIGMDDIAVTVPGTEIPLASLNAANIDLKLMPLVFGGSVEVSGISIDGLTINAAVDANGKGSWEVSGASATDTAGETSSEETTGSNNLTIDIGGIQITNTTINYQDLSTDASYVISMPELTTGPLGTGVSTKISAEINFQDVKAGASVSNQISGNLTINESLDEFLLGPLAVATKLQQPDSPELAVELLLNGKVNTSTEEAKLTNSSLTLGGATFTADMDVSNLFGDLRYNGKLEAPAFNAKALLAALDADPGVTANPAALSKLAIKAGIKGSASQLVLSGVNIQLDESTLTGAIEVGLGELTTLDFGLNIDQITVSDYLAPTAETTESTATAGAQTANADSELIPRDTLATLRVNGQFAIEELAYEQWQLQNLNLKIGNKNRKLDLNGSAEAYDGNMGFTFRSEYPETNTRNRAEVTITGIDIAKALEVQAITGAVELKSTHQWQGHMLSGLVESLDGSATFEIVDGTLDVRPIKQLAVLVDGIQGTQSGIADWPDLLPFKSLNGNHKVNEGIVTDQTFVANLENMNLSGEGGIDYFDNSMAYDIEAVLINSANSQFTVSDKLANVKWPLRCAGDLNADPMTLCLPDRNAITDLLKRMAAEEVKRRGRDAIQEKIEEAVPEELKDAAKGLLKGLFGN